SGGHYTDEVYEASKRLGIHYVVPIKGANVYGKPVANFPRKRNSKGVFLTEVGTDNAKEIIYSRLRIQPEPGQPVPGCVHLPANSEICDEEELRQLTAEVKLARISNGRRVYRWESKGRRNEALDCFVYALAALRISQQRFGFNLDAEIEPGPKPDQTRPAAPAPENRGSSGGDWLNLQNSGGSWL
ncbi:MAG TPA: terminase gpA endonuclease subunit, partial [Acidimicrobiia bacterium]